MKKTINIAGTSALIAAMGLALAYAANEGSKREEKYVRELNAHVIETWKDAPEDFHGHDCKYGDWCTKAHYDHLIKK